MNLDQLIERIASYNGLDKPERENGRYQIALQGADVMCFEEDNKLCLLCDLAPLAASESSRQSDCRRLLEKNMELIRDSRAVLTMDEGSGSYQLYQRTLLDEMTPTEFQELLEGFGGYCCYFQELLNNGKGGGQGVSAGGNIMMP